MTLPNFDSDAWRKTEPGVDGKACGARWEHITGAWVQHCGHPTALRPYYGAKANGDSIIPEGQGAFRHLAVAKAAALAI